MMTGTWLEGVTPNNAVVWFGVTYGGDKFVAIGYGDDNDKRAIYSYDGKTWLTAIFTPLAYHVVWFDVAFGNNKFIAVGSGVASTYHFMTSPDGVTWITTTGGITRADWRGVCGGTDKFVAVGCPGSGGLDSQRACYSSDGVSWTLSTTPNALSTTYWHDVDFGNGKYIAVGKATDITKQAMISTDGIAWSLLTTPNVNTSWYKITYNDGIWVAVGNSDTDETIQIMYSTDDGLTWSTDTTGVPTTPAYWYAVKSGGGMFIAGTMLTSGSESLIYSYNGKNWFPLAVPNADMDFRCLAYGLNTWVALGENSTDRTKSAIYMIYSILETAIANVFIPSKTVGSLIVGQAFDIDQYELGRYEADYPFSVIFNYRDGGFKKKIYIGSDSCPIKKVKFALNEKGCANGKIEFAYLDWTIDKYDSVEIYYKGRKIYRGLVNDKPDIDGGEISLVPQRVRLEHFIFDRIKYEDNIWALTVLENAVKTKSDYHKVTYNPYFLDEVFKDKDVDLVTPEFQDSEIKNMIEDIVTTIDGDAVWGVNENNIFFVRYPEATVSKRLFLSDDPYYRNIKVTTQYNNIKLTRAIVYRKGDETETEDVFCGYVCYGDDQDNDKYYDPIPSLENEVGIIEQIVSIPSVVYDETAIDYAYHKIASQQIEKTIDIEGLDIAKYFPEVGKKIQVEKVYDQKVLWTLSDCETLDGWEGSCAVSDDRAVEGDHSIMAGVCWYRMDNVYLFDGIEKIEFFIYCEKEDFELQIDILKGSDVVKSTVVNFQNFLWQRIEIAIDTEFDGIGFYPSDLFWIDRIKVYSYRKEVYEANIKEIEFNIDAKGYECNLTLGNFDVLVNDTLQWLEWKVGVLDGIKHI